MDEHGECEFLRLTSIAFADPYGSSSRDIQDMNVGHIGPWMLLCSFWGADEMREAMLDVLGQEKYEFFFDKVSLPSSYHDSGH
jgi:hypothetical protein